MDLLQVFIQIFLAVRLGIIWSQSRNAAYIACSGGQWAAITWVFNILSWSPVSNPAVSQELFWLGTFFLGCVAAIVFGLIENFNNPKKQPSRTLR